MYTMLNNNNPIVKQTVQHDKEVYIANQIVRLLRSEKLTSTECDNVIKMAKERVCLYV